MTFDLRTGQGETLYLCKLDPNAKGEPRFIALIGRIIREVDGYRFLPNVNGRKGSRKAWPSANQAIPRWTEDMGFLRLFDSSEYWRAQQ